MGVGTKLAEAALEVLGVAKKAAPKATEIAGNAEVRKIAEEFVSSKGMKPNFPTELSNVNEKRAKKIATAFEEMQHNPNDPKVKKAYDALIQETNEQFEAIKKSGIKFQKIKPGQENPYKSSQDLHNDIKNNKNMWYYPTEQGFGTDASKFGDHPLLKQTEMLDADGNKMPANDIFRVVHDYFGHAKEGTSFGPKGEENAWLQHMNMYGDDAKKALSSETRGQNSWVNFGSHGELNRANPAATKYADQKAGLLPDWALRTDADDSKRLKMLAGAGATGAAVLAAPSKAEAIDIVRAPIDAIKEGAIAAYDKSQEVTGNIGHTLADIVTPQNKYAPETREQVLETGSEMGKVALDPTNFIAPAAKTVGALGMLAKAGKHVNMAEALTALRGGSKFTKSGELAKLGTSLQDLNKTGRTLIAADTKEAATNLQKLNKFGKLELPNTGAPKLASKNVEPTLENLNKTGKIKTQKNTATKGMGEQRAMQRDVEMGQIKADVTNSPIPISKIKETRDAAKANVLAELEADKSKGIIRSPDFVRSRFKWHYNKLSGK